MSRLADGRGDPKRMQGTDMHADTTASALHMPQPTCARAQTRRHTDTHTHRHTGALAACVSAITAPLRGCICVNVSASGCVP
eukprot:3471005-Alexandrium_andersonii.AAC.1